MPRSLEPRHEVFTGEHRGFSYVINADKIDRLFNKYDWAAKVVRLVRFGTPSVDVSYLGSEHWGETPGQAWRLAEDEARRWIDRQLDKQ